MSRIFYEIKEEKFRDQAANGRIFEKVIKLIPTEIIVAYMTVLGLITKIQDLEIQHVVKWLVFYICLAATPLYLYKLAEVKKGIGAHLFLSTVAFIIWAYSVSGKVMLSPLYFDSAVASISLVLFTLVSGLVPVTNEKN